MKHLVLPTWTWSKRLTMIIVIIPVLIFLAFVAAISLIDFNQYKPQIEDEVSQRTGYEFKIEGPIDVSIFPFVFSAGHVALKNPQPLAERFARENLLAIKQVRAELSMWALLIDRELSIKGLEFMEPELSLLRDKDGYNWKRLEALAGFSQPLLQEWVRQSAVATTKDLEAFNQSNRNVRFVSERETDIEPPAKQKTAWHFDSLIIKQGTFEHQDRRVQHQGKISNLNLLAFNVTLGQPFQVRSDFEYQNSVNDRRYQFDVSANLGISHGFSLWEITNWQGIFNLKLPEKSNVPAMRLVTEGAQFSLDLLNEKIEVSGLMLSSLGSKLSASFKGVYGTNTALSGSMSALGVNLPKWFYHLGLPLPGFVDRKALTALNGDLNWGLADHKWSFNDINLQIDDSVIKGNIWHERKQPSKSEDVAYLFDLNVDKLDLNRYVAKANDGFLARLQAMQNVEGVTDLNDVQKRASKNVVNKVSRPANKIDENATYLPIALPVSTLKGLNAAGQLSFDSLAFEGVTLTAVDIDLTAKQGQIQLAPFDASLYSGSLISKLTLNVNGETPAYNWYGQLEGLALGSLIEAGWQTKPLDGILNAHFRFNTLGSNAQVLTQNLQGEFNARSEKGAFYGVALNQLLMGQRLAANDKMPYKNLALKGKIENGVYSAKQLSVKSDGFSGSGFGSLDLNKAIISSQMKLRVNTPPASLSHLKGVLVPVSYNGTLPNAEWTVDLQSLLKGSGNQ